MLFAVRASGYSSEKNATPVSCVLLVSTIQKWRLVKIARLDPTVTSLATLTIVPSARSVEGHGWFHSMYQVRCWPLQRRPGRLSSVLQARIASLLSREPHVHPCKENTYSYHGASQCVSQCPSGKYAVEGDPYNECRDCEIGKYMQTPFQVALVLS